MVISSYDSGMLFTQAHKQVRRRIVSALAQYNISPTHWSILSVVANAKEGVRLSTVAAKLDVKAPLITMESSGLIKNGLLLRIPHHTDTRAKLLVITPKGKSLLKSVEKDLSKHIEELLEGLTSEEIASFQKALTVIIANS